MQYHPWLVGMRRAMELMLTGDAMSGREAAEWGYTTRCFPLADLDEKTLNFAERAAKVPIELQQLNKRSVHRAMEIMGGARRNPRRYRHPGACLYDRGEQGLHGHLSP